MPRLVAGKLGHKFNLFSADHLVAGPRVVRVNRGTAIADPLLDTRA
jgi:hypothetical protein